ncbi:MAG: hypothetical protein ACRDIV_13230 [Ktedonobacteraceae bacterium]
MRGRVVLAAGRSRQQSAGRRGGRGLGRVVALAAGFGGVSLRHRERCLGGSVVRATGIGGGCPSAAGGGTRSDTD